MIDSKTTKMDLGLRMSLGCENEANTERAKYRAM